MIQRDLISDFLLSEGIDREILNISFDYNTQEFLVSLERGEYDIKTVYRVNILILLNFIYNKK